MAKTSIVRAYYKDGEDSFTIELQESPEVMAAMCVLEHRNALSAGSQPAR